MTHTQPTAPRAAAVVTWIVTVIVSIAGVVMSAAQLVDLAALSGWGPEVAWLLPVLLDGSGIAGGLAYRFAATRSARRWGLGVLIESAALSVFGNVAAHVLVAATAPLWVAAVVGVAVPVQIVLTVHMGILLSTGATEPATPSATTTEDAPVTEDAPATVAAEPAPVVNPEPVAAAPVARLHSIPSPAESAVECSAEPVEGADTGDAAATSPGGIQAAMRVVFDQHQAAGTEDALTATQLAREAGQGSRQLASRYLREWRDEAVISA